MKPELDSPNLFNEETAYNPRALILPKASADHGSIVDNAMIFP